MEMEKLMEKLSIEDGGGDAPRPAASPTDSRFCYLQDVWMLIAKHLDGKSLLKLAASKKWLWDFIMSTHHEKGDHLWMLLFFKDFMALGSDNSKSLEAFAPYQGQWANLYSAVIDRKVHSFNFHEQTTHIGMLKRIGCFVCDGQALMTRNLFSRPAGDLLQHIIPDLLHKSGHCQLTRVMAGIWIADVHRVACCEDEECGAEMNILEARHIFLFSKTDFRDGSTII